jgi:hypothetical protein
MPAILPSCSANLPGRLEVVERHHPHEVGEGLRDAHRLVHRDRVLARTHVGGVGRHREHQGIVVAVVGALDLHEHVAPGVRAHQAPGLERRLGARVAEAPQRKPEAIGEVLPDHVEVLRGLGEVRATLGLSLDRLDDLRVGVARHHRAVAEVEVDVLVLVDVPDVVAAATVDVDRVRWRVLPTRGDPAGHVAIGDLAIGDRRRARWGERGFLTLDQAVDQVQIELHPCCHGAISSFEEPPQPPARTTRLNGGSNVR